VIRTCTKIKLLVARHTPHPCKIKKIITVRRQLTFGVISKIPIQLPLHPETKDIAKIKVAKFFLEHSVDRNTHTERKRQTTKASSQRFVIVGSKYEYDIPIFAKPEA